ncbi:MAG TPA: hypothetical protein VGR89_00275 [Puia sp.]|nr:hypothetical protein [Puia sp.]
MYRCIFFLIPALLSHFCGEAQWKSYIIGVKGDTLNCVDQQDRKQGRWSVHTDELRGEPGFDEEGVYKDNRKEGMWRIYDLDGDLTGLEYYKWGNKNGVCQYFASNGALIREESWIALNPDRVYDTLVVEDVDHPDHYKTVVVKNEGVAIRDGAWKFYDATTGMVARTDTYDLGKLIKSQSGRRVAPDSTQAVAKPKEVLEFEKRASKHKVKVQDGSAYQ